MRSGFSVYNLKYVLRSALDRAAFLERLNPNLISVSLLVPAVLLAYALIQGLWVLAIVAVLWRMFVATLDGYIAQTYDKSSRLGAYVNRSTAQIGDALMLLALLSRAEPLWVALALALTWLVDMHALLGVAAGGTLQWTGPGAQADRLTLVLLASVFSLFSSTLDWTLLLQLMCALLALTLVRRVGASIAELRVVQP